LHKATKLFVFMSPERLRDDPLSIQSDIFSLSVTAFVLLSGKYPFQGNNLHEHIELRKVEPLKISSIVSSTPPSIDDIFIQALHPDPLKRYQSASEFASALENILQQRPAIQKVSLFISYSREDPGIANQLVQGLGENQFNVWFDKTSIEVGKAWEPQIRKGIRDCDKFIVILSPDAVESEYVQAEIDYAKEKQKTIIPIVHRKCDIPLHVRLLQHIDFSQLGYGRGFELLLRAIIE
jgi:serine/threonine protein kinase